MQNYNNRELIDSLRYLYIKLGRAPRYEKDFGSKNNLPSSCLFVKRFDSFNNALKIAGIPITKEHKKYTNKQLISLLKKFAKTLGRTPRRKDIYNNKSMPDPNTYKNRFGSFNNAIKLASLEITNSKFFYYSNEDLIKLLNNVSNKIKRTPNKYDFKCNKELPSMWIYINRFGSYNNAVLKAGLKLNRGFADNLAIHWEEHCKKIARSLFEEIKTNIGFNKKVGKPDIWVDHKKLYIDAKLSLVHKEHIKDQIKRYTKDDFKLQFWCLTKHPFLEIKNKNVSYIYAKDMVKIFKGKISDELLEKTYLFINNTFSPKQKSIREFR